jgi:hypothetical protein
MKLNGTGTISGLNRNANIATGAFYLAIARGACEQANFDRAIRCDGDDAGSLPLFVFILILWP